MASPVNNSARDEERLDKKLAWAPGLLLTSIVTILLLASDRAPWTNSGRFYNFVTTNRASVQIVVQFLSQGFGALNIYSVCSLIGFGNRLRLTKTSYTLDQLKFWRAICLQQLDWALPLGLVVIVTLFRAILLVPGSIWAGALTPVPVTVQSLSTQPLDVPQYTSASENIWGNLKWTSPMRSTRDPRGVFSYSPNYDFLGIILTQAASASSINGTTPILRKLDNTRYSYLGRSYGVGSPVGLVDQAFSHNTTQNYTYNEIGYDTRVHCAVNSTSNWTISDEGYDINGNSPNIYWARGTLANGNLEGYAACGLDKSPRSIFALVGSSTGGGNIFTIAAGEAYAALDKVQCAVEFTRSEFAVSVNYTERLITVQPVKNGLDIKDIEPKGNLTRIAMRMPTSFSQQHACDLYTSLVGDTFTQNIRGVHSLFDPSNSTKNGTDLLLTSQVITGVQDSLTSMLDNSLLAFSSAQLMIPRDVHPVPVSLSISAIRIGESAYIYAVATINFVIVSLSLLELARTRTWKGLPRFDFTDVKSLILGVAKGGGTQVAEQAWRIHARYEAQIGKDEKVENRALGRIRVRLEGFGPESRLVGTPREEGMEKGEEMWKKQQERKAGVSDSESEALAQGRDARDRDG